jgi:hypothetical protein
MQLPPLLLLQDEIRQFAPLRSATSTPLLPLQLLFRQETLVRPTCPQPPSRSRSALAWLALMSTWTGVLVGRKGFGTLTYARGYSGE